MRKCQVSVLVLGLVAAPAFAADGTFGTVLQSFAFDSGAGYNTGISPQTSGGNPLPLWVTDFTSMNANVLDSGTDMWGEIFSDGFESGTFDGWHTSMP